MRLNPRSGPRLTPRLGSDPSPQERNGTRIRGYMPGSVYTESVERPTPASDASDSVKAITPHSIACSEARAGNNTNEGRVRHRSTFKINVQNVKRATRYVKSGTKQKTVIVSGQKDISSGMPLTPRPQGRGQPRGRSLPLPQELERDAVSRIYAEECIPRKRGTPGAGLRCFWVSVKAVMRSPAGTGNEIKACSEAERAGNNVNEVGWRLVRSRRLAQGQTGATKTKETSIVLSQDKNRYVKSNNEKETVHCHQCRFFTSRWRVSSIDKTTLTWSGVKTKAGSVQIFSSCF